MRNGTQTKSVDPLWQYMLIRSTKAETECMIRASPFICGTTWLNPLVSLTCNARAPCATFAGSTPGTTRFLPPPKMAPEESKHFCHKN